jgi:hypothetical protein
MVDYGTTLPWVLFERLDICYFEFTISATQIRGNTRNSNHARIQKKIGPKGHLFLCPQKCLYAVYFGFYCWAKALMAFGDLQMFFWKLIVEKYPS